MDVLHAEVAGCWESVKGSWVGGGLGEVVGRWLGHLLPYLKDSKTDLTRGPRCFRRRSRKVTKGLGNAIAIETFTQRNVPSMVRKPNDLGKVKTKVSHEMIWSFFKDIHDMLVLQG